MLYIYALKLTQNKYYIGKTKNPDLRIETHFNHKGSAWTKTYPPIEINMNPTPGDVHDEDKYTAIYMDKYGIDNVRGGMYVELVLSSEDIAHIQKRMLSTMDLCFKCGSSEHYAKYCKSKRTRPIICFKCKIPGHISTNCHIFRTSQQLVTLNDTSANMNNKFDIDSNIQDQYLVTLNDAIANMNNKFDIDSNIQDQYLVTLNDTDSNIVIDIKNDIQNQQLQTHAETYTKTNFPCILIICIVIGFLIFGIGMIVYQIQK